MQHVRTENKIELRFTTNGVRCEIDLDFCLGKWSDSVFSSSERLRFGSAYPVEVLSDGYLNAFRIVAEEGPLIVRYSNMRICEADAPAGERREYAFAAVVDTKSPELVDGDLERLRNADYKRDGEPWHIPLSHNLSTFDQNADAKYQLTTKRAAATGEQPAREDEELTTGSTGVIYITVAPLYQRKASVTPCRTRGLGVTRGASPAEPNVQAAVGYGLEASTPSEASPFKPIPGTGCLTFPVRFMIRGGTKSQRDVACSETIAKADAVRDDIEMVKARICEAPL